MCSSMFSVVYFRFRFWPRAGLAGSDSPSDSSLSSRMAAAISVLILATVVASGSFTALPPGCKSWDIVRTESSSSWSVESTSLGLKSYFLKSNEQRWMQKIKLKKPLNTLGFVTQFGSWVRMWVVNVVRLLNVLEHFGCSHWYGFLPAWVRRCRARLLESVKAISQVGYSHWWGRSPVWTWMWFCKAERYRDNMSHVRINVQEIIPEQRTCHNLEIHMETDDLLYENACVEQDRSCAWNFWYNLIGHNDGYNDCSCAAWVLDAVILVDRGL